MKKIMTLLLLNFTFAACIACTTFFINKNGQHFFGRNYDWVTGAGIINSNQRGLFKTSSHTVTENSISWVSQYASITFNQYGKEFPTGGMNEKGLVVELMWLDGTRYPSEDQRPAVNVLQWIQYQLDNCTTTKDVIATDIKLRITTSGTPLHYLVADASGNVASIEFLEGKMIVHQGENLPYPVLTNSTYEVSSKTASSVIKAKTASLPTDNSLQRFVKACQMLNKLNVDDLKVPLTDYAFLILNNVSQGNFTKWSIVYDLNNKEILFKTADNRNTRKIRFRGFDFNCTQPSKMYDMEQAGVGDITDQFINPDKNIKKRSLEKAIQESIDNVKISEASKERMLNYEDAVTCK